MGNEITTPRDLVGDLRETAELLQVALNGLDEAGRNKARAEDTYRYQRSIALTRIAGTDQARNAEMRDAAVYLWRVEGTAEGGTPMTVGDLRYARDLAESGAQGALERVRGLRTILSALQTTANALREEAALARTGGDDWAGR